MATKTFGIHKEKQADAPRRDYIAEMQKLVGAEFPLSIEVGEADELRGVSYDTEWQEGTTEPVGTGEFNENGVEQLEYKPKYKKQKLTKEQIKKLDGYISKNIKTE